MINNKEEEYTLKVLPSTGYGQEDEDRSMMSNPYVSFDCHMENNPQDSILIRKYIFKP